MATIGLDKLFYSKITENENGEETYATPVPLAKVKSNLSAVIGKDTKTDSRSTGELERSLGLSPVLIDNNGNANIKIGFKEPRFDSESNAKIASIIEYGKQGQPPKPFLKPAKTSSKKACVKAMVDTLEQEVKNL